MTDQRPYMTPAEVADLFRVDVHTVQRWAKTGKLPHILTPSGHRRFPRADIEARLQVRGQR